jgi:hypothetical protein
VPGQVGPGAGGWSKNYWADSNKVWFFFNLIFMFVRILSFNVIHSVMSVIKKMFLKGPVAAPPMPVNGLALWSMGPDGIFDLLEEIGPIPEFREPNAGIKWRCIHG